MKKTKKDVHFRRKYVNYTGRLVEWVDNLGLEKTFVGKATQFLEEKFQIKRILYIFLYGLILSFILFIDLDYSQNVEIDEIAVSDIKSPMNLQIVDEVATRLKMSEAERDVLPVFDYDPEAYEKVVNRVYNAFNKMREKIKVLKWPQSEEGQEEVIKNFLQHKPLFESEIGVSLRKPDFEWLVSKRFSVQLENIIIRTLSDWSQLKVVGAYQSAIEDGKNQVLIRAVDPMGKGHMQAIDTQSLVDIRNREYFSFDAIAGTKVFRPRELATLKRIVYALLIPNVTFNNQETTFRRQQAREAVLPVQISIKRNQTIVNAGSKIQPIHVAILSEIESLKSDQRKEFISLLSAMLFVVCILVFVSFFRRFTKSHLSVSNKEYLIMGTVAALIAGLTKLFLFMTDAAFITRFGTLIPPSMFIFAAPVAAGPMLVGLMMTYGEIVWIFTAFMSIALSLMIDNNFTFFLLCMVGGIAGARGVYNCEKRNDIYWAGLRVGAINALIITFMVIINNSSTGGNVFTELSWNVPAGFLGGVFSSMVTMTLIPLLESLFNVTTDIKLLELSNLNHPLMKQMMVKAPGTYHHSLAVGTMVEEAASKIGANSLLAKVMAFYHDIGKMEHAQYFVENQRPGYNPHDHITPFMSKTILIAHVKDGAELGLQHKLGKPIIDGILQHHGTTLISYFYNKAIAEQDEDLSQIEESEFRYPGPKPQFKEAALVMLGDSIEAAARSMDEPTSARLTHLVKNIIQNKFIDGQLSECNLTLSELSVIEKAFKKTLLSIYHQRMDYPHMKLGAPVSTENKSKRNLRGVSS